MKQKIIKTDKATLLVVELPDGARDVVVTIFNRIGFYLHNSISSYEMLPEGNWQLLGRIPDITEDQADKVVESEDFKHYSGQYFHMFVDYNNCENAFDNSFESLSSLLKANDIWFENRELKWKTFDTKEKYEQAQSEVWDKERTYIFIKVD